MPRQPPRNQTKLVWVMVGIGFFLVVCIVLTLFMIFAKIDAIE